MVRTGAEGSPSRLNTAHACVWGLAGVAPGVTHLRMQTGLQLRRGWRPQTGTRRNASGVQICGNRKSSPGTALSELPAFAGDGSSLGPGSFPGGSYLSPAARGRLLLARKRGVG